MKIYIKLPKPMLSFPPSSNCTILILIAVLISLLKNKIE